MIQNEDHVHFVCTGGYLAHHENHKKVLNCRAKRKSDKSSIIYNTCALQIGAQNLAAVAQTDFLGAPEVDFVLLFTIQNGCTIKKHCDLSPRNPNRNPNGSNRNPNGSNRNPNGSNRNQTGPIGTQRGSNWNQTGPTGIQLEPNGPNTNQYGP